MLQEGKACEVIDMRSASAPALASALEADSTLAPISLKMLHIITDQCTEELQKQVGSLRMIIRYGMNEQ